MDSELYKRMDVAAKFVSERSLEVSHEEQAATGLDWASRQQQRPEPEPVAVMKPIVPVA
jgi:hypothetical protein